MVNPGEPRDPLGDEVLAKYPDLGRARKLFINLFQDRSPLVNLGYTGRHIEYAIPVLELLKEEGVVETYLRDNPFLRFTNKRDQQEGLEIYRLLSKQGFSLNAFKEGGASISGLSGAQRLLIDMFSLPSQRQKAIFADLPFQVAHIALFEPEADINNLEYLIRELSQGFTYTDALLGVQPENPLTKAARAIGVTATFRAAWMDEETKREFVAKIDVPEDRELGSVFVAYRKLSPVSDLKGGVIPIGKKPNTSENKVMGILNAVKKRVVSGQLAYGSLGARN